MKGFKKRCFWILFGIIGLIGFLFIVDLAFLQESTLILKANAQNPQYNPGGIEIPRTESSYFPSDLEETITTCSGGCTETASTCVWGCGPTFSLCGTREDPSRGSSGSNRFGQVSILGLFGQSYTFGTCPTLTTCNNSLFGICGSGSYPFGIRIGTEIPTSKTCSGGIFCGRGANTTFI